jgi:hypothetical protein
MMTMTTMRVRCAAVAPARVHARARGATRATTRSAVKTRAAADDLKDKLSEVTATLSEKWEESDEKPAIVTLGVYGLIGLVAANGTLRAVDSLPLVPDVLELVGILFSGFFVYQNLLYKPDRAALKETVTKTLNKIL